MSQRLIVALDTAERQTALRWASAVAPHCGLVKLGLAYFAGQGPAGVAAIGGVPVFLDLKLHDIPATVAAAVRALAPLAPAMLTLHAGGGPAMIAAARRAAGESGMRTKLLAVTVLTSLDDADLNSLGVPDGAAAQVVRLAGLALEAGADGLVCSAREVASLRRRFGPAPVLVTPGIREPGAAAQDQARVMSPAEAVAAGADYLVVGRPVTQAADPAVAAAHFARLAA